MDEDAARAWVEASDVPRETFARLNTLVEHVREEAHRQNLIAGSTLDVLWSRHVVDSLQLIPLAPPSGEWLDIGTGAGFPGLAVAIATDRAMILVEPRTRRAAFLDTMIDALALRDRVRVVQGRIEMAVRQQAKPAIITARAVASLERLFGMAATIADETTTWILPKGRSARDELAAARRTWQGEFRLVPSITDPDAAIVVATHVRPRTRR